jgi:hypothetical protein
MKQHQGKISKDTLLMLGLTLALSIFGGWSAGTEKQNDLSKRVSLIEQKCSETDARYDQIIEKLDAMNSSLNEVKSDVKLLNATKVDRKYVE